MLNLLQTNKEWLFSGAGVTALLLVGGFVRWLWGRKKQAVAKGPAPTRHGEPIVSHAEAPHSVVVVPPSTSRGRISSLTLAEVIESIGNAPVLQQSSVASRYKGIVVQWEGSFSNAFPGKDGTVRVILRVGRAPSFTSAACEVKLSDYPELKVLLDGHKIRVTGRISDANHHRVELEDAELFIYPTA